jgi:hypothetical protein
MREAGALILQIIMLVIAFQAVLQVCLQLYTFSFNSSLIMEKKR